MATKKVQIRKDSAVNLDAATPDLAELGFDTTNNRLRAGNAVKLGGWQLPNIDDIQSGRVNTTATTGSANAIALAYSPATEAGADYTTVKFKYTFTKNTNSVTAAIDGRAAITCKKIKAGAIVNLEDGDLIQNAVYTGTIVGGVLLINNLGSQGSQAGWNLLGVASGGAPSYDFTGLITAAYKNYALILEQVIPVTNNVELLLRVRRAGQGSYDASGYNFNNAYHPINSLDAYRQATGANQMNIYCKNSGGVTFNGVQNAANGSSGISGTVYGFGLNNAAKNHFKWNTVQVGAGDVEMSGFGYRNTAAALDSMQVLFGSGDIASGAGYLYGLRASL